MVALRNILSDLLFQFRLRGGLAARVSCVLRYYWLYGLGRLGGGSQDASRMAALEAMAKAGYSRRTVRVRWPGDFQAEFDLFSAAFMVKEMAADRMYEELPGFAPASGATVVDVGAHQGVFTLLAASRVGARGRVVSVEALPSNRRLLEGNVAGNGLKQVTIAALAAGEAAGRATFHVFPLVTGGSLVLKPEGAEPIEVEVDRLDAILERAGVGKVDLLKIDVEGAALGVLKGAPKTLAGRPRIVLEVEGGDAEIARVRDFLEKAGYRVQAFAAILYASPA